VVETVNFSIGLVMIFNRLDDIGAPVFPPTFRVVEALEEQDCQLLSNGGPFASLTAGSYTYVRTTGGIETDREESAIIPQIDIYAIYLNCDNIQNEDPPSSVRFTIATDPDGPGVSTLPFQWSYLFSSSPMGFTNIGAINPGIGVRTIIETDALGDWDTSSLVNSASVAITRCEDI